MFNTCAILLFRIFYSYNLEVWYLYLFLATYNILYLLNNLEFWGLAAQVFDVRQSKRLFGVISAGDIPAKMIGFLSAYLIIPFIGTENLLLVAASLTLISTLLVGSLFKHIHTNKPALKKSKHFFTSSIKSIHTVITGNILIRKIAIVSFFSFAIFLIVNFIFYGYVKAEFKSDKDLVSFFAIFLAITRLITFGLKIAVANKMTDKIGLRNALMIPPLILFIICAVGLYLIQQFEGNKFTFYLFGVLSVITDVLRSAIQTPVLLAVLQPLPLNQRLKGHTIIKGLMDPFAFLITGVFLWIFTSTQSIDFIYLNYVIIGLILFWAFFTWSVEKDYLRTLHTAISNKSLNEREIIISDKASLNYLLNKLINGDETEAISVLKLVSEQSIQKKIYFEEGLKHNAKNVNLATLAIIQDSNAIEMLPSLQSFLTQEEKELILPEIITTINVLDSNFKMDDFIKHPNADVVFAATLSTIPKLEIDDKEKAEQVLYQLFHNKGNTNKINALKVVAKLKMMKFEYKVIELMFSENEQIKSSARSASAALGTEQVIIKLIEDFNINKNDTDILEALAKIGSKVVKKIEPILIENKCHGVKARKLILLLGKVHSIESKNLLENLLETYPENADAIIISLNQNKTKSTKSTQEIHQLIKQHLDSAVQILFNVNFTKDINSVVTNAFELELNTIRNKCLYWFSCLHDIETINKVRNGFYINTKESIANAIEIIQLTVSKDYGKLFALVFENSSINDRCLQLEVNYNSSKLSETVLTKNILFDVNYAYSNWTKACVLYHIKDSKNILSKEFLQPFAYSKNEVLKNTAEHIISILNDN
ncbi:MAG: MFS transporter [Chitinophagaceae bacterium]|nr:MFS transporter [Chitinophagaceae bacterium]